MKPDQFLAFKSAHATALSDLRSYALDSQLDADRLNPILHAKDMSAMVAAAPSLGQYLACSVFIDELYHALISLAVQTNTDMTDDPQYQAWVESMAKHCRCSSDRPCAGVLAGGLCDDLQDNPCDDDRASLAYEQDDSDPHGLGGI